MLALFLLLATQVAGFKAAVVEYTPYFNDTTSRSEALEILRFNLDQYGEFIANASRLGAQIIVFPEDGLYGAGHPRESIVSFCEPVKVHSQCESIGEESYVAKSVSCLAKRFGLAIVWDMCDKVQLSNGSTRIYNTQVAALSNGTVIAKYHKDNLYFGEPFDRPEDQPPVSFTSLFGVKFGMFICFDIFFSNPTLELLRQGVVNFVYSSMWVNFAPFLTATQVQNAWARYHGVTVLAANIGDSQYNSGSGIYDGNVKGMPRRQTVVNVGFSPRNTMLVAELPVAVPSGGLRQPPLTEKVPPSSRSPLMWDGVQVFPKVGLHTVVNASVRDVHCSLEFAAFAVEKNESFVLLAVRGEYAEMDSSVCFFGRCDDPATVGCLTGKEFHWHSSAAFSYARLTASTPSSTETLVMAAEDGGTLPEERFLGIERQGDTTRLVWDSGKPLLDLTVFGRIVQAPL